MSQDYIWLFMHQYEIISEKLVHLLLSNNDPAKSDRSLEDRPVHP